MFVNQANLRGLNVTFSTAYNKAFDGERPIMRKLQQLFQDNSRDRL